MLIFKNEKKHPIPIFFVLFASCKSTENLNSAPELNSSNRKEVNLISEVNVDKARTPSAAGNSYVHLSAEDKAFIDGLFKDVINNIKDPVALDSVARVAVMLGSMGMKLMAAFDLKIEKLANSPQPTEKDLNYIKNDITCQLWESSFVQHINKRKPNQNQDKDYNWQKRSHTGRELKEHEFIVTYDDGPHAEYTQKIADSWAKSEFKLPTFFWLTKNIIAYPQIAMNLLTNNFPIGLHSYTHADLGNLSSATNITKLNSVNKKNFAGELKKVKDATFNSWRNGKLKNEIVTAKSEYEAIINKYEPGRNFKIKHFRLPFGSGMKNPEIGKLLEQTNMEHYFWAIDSLDWNDKNPLTIKERVLTQMTINKKGIILFHDIHKQSSLATIELINHFKDNSNLKVVSINDLNKP